VVLLKPSNICIYIHLIYNSVAAAASWARPTATARRRARRATARGAGSSRSDVAVGDGRNDARLGHEGEIIPGSESADASGVEKKPRTRAAGASGCGEREVIAIKRKRFECAPEGAAARGHARRARLA
jgi:hypothetical protein